MRKKLQAKALAEQATQRLKFERTYENIETQKIENVKSIATSLGKLVDYLEKSQTQGPLDHFEIQGRSATREQPAKKMKHSKSKRKKKSKTKECYSSSSSSSDSE